MRDEAATAQLREQYFALLRALNEGQNERRDFDFAQVFPLSGDIGVLLAQVDDLKRCIDSFRPLEDAQVHNLRRALTASFTYESNRIEGNTLTLQETALILEKGVTVSGKSLKEHLEVTGHAQAFDYVQDVAQSDEPISQTVLRRVHQLVLGGVDRKNAGAYRTIDVAIAGSAHQPPPNYLVQERMDALFAWAEGSTGRLHPVVFAAELHHRLVNIHPFVDGNGRTARLLMNLVLLRHGYPIANLSGEREARLAYYQALAEADAGDGSQFHRLVLLAVRATSLWMLPLISTSPDATKGAYFFERIAPFLRA
jgi:Fic family protein